MKLTAVKCYRTDLGNSPQRTFAIRASMNCVIFSFIVICQLFTVPPPGVFSDIQTILHSINYIKRLVPLKRISAFLILNVLPLI